MGLNVHIHRSDLAGFVLLHPQLSVFGWIHVLQQLVDRFHHLQTNRHMSPENISRTSTGQIQRTEGMVMAADPNTGPKSDLTIMFGVQI